MDVGDLTSTATEAISNITDSGVAASVGTAAVTGSPMLAPLAGLIGTTFGQCAVENFLDDAEGALRNYSEQNQKEDQPSAALTKLSVGMADVISLASSNDGPKDPEKLETFMKELLEDESRREDVERIEQTLAAIFHGDVEPPSDVDIGDNPQSVFDTMQEVFDTTDHQEALQMFLLYEEVIGGLRGYYDGDNDDAAQILESKQMKMDEWHQTLIDDVIKRDVESQGFDILTTRQFTKKVPFPNESEPVSGWVVGYKWPDLIATNDNGHHYYFERPAPDNYLQTRESNAIIDKQKSETPAAESVVDAVISQLRNEGNLLLHGRPGSGKSHICQRVAVEWFNTHDYGEVYYRKGSAENQIGKYYKQIKGAIRRSRDVGDGHVLVVVEDATREEAKKIFDLIGGYRNSKSANVSFLLDARTSEWGRYAENSGKDWIDVDGSESLAVTNVPPVSKSDCENAIETFNATIKKGRYKGSAQSLYDTISEDYSTEGRGELLVLANEIVRESEYDGDLPLALDASEVHSGTPETKGLLDVVDTGGTEAPMFYKLAVGIATLTAAEIPIKPALLYSLADEESEYYRVKQLLDDDPSLHEEPNKIPVPIRGVFVFLDSNSGSYTPRHALWGEAFLNDGINDNLRPNHKLHKTFIHVVSQFASLADEGSKRRLIKHVFADWGRSKSEYLGRFEEDEPGEVANEFLTSIYDFGERNSQSERDSTFVSLFEGTAFSDPISGSVPKACSPILEFQLRLRYAKMVKYTDEYEPPSGRSPKEIIEQIRSDADDQLDSLYYGHIEIESYLALYNLYNNAEYVKQAVQQADTIDIEDLPVDFLIEFTSISIGVAPWTELENIHDTAVDKAKRINNPVASANKLDTLLNAAIQSVSWKNIVDTYDGFITAAKQIDHPETKADMFASFLRSSIWETEWENIVDAYDEGIVAAKQIEDPKIKADTLNILLNSGISETEWENIVDAYYEGITATRQIDDPVTRLYTLSSLLRTASSGAGWENIVDTYNEGISAADQIDDPERRADILRLFFKAGTKLTEWENIAETYNKSIIAAKQIDDPITKVDNLSYLLSAATQGNEWENIADAYNECITAAKQIDDPKTKADTLDSFLRHVSLENEWDNLVDAYNEFFVAAKQIDDPIKKAETLDLWLRVAAFEGEWENLREIYNEFFAATEQIDDPKTKIRTLTPLLAIVALETKCEWKNIVDTYDEAIAAAKQIDDPGTKVGDIATLLRTATQQTEWDNIVDTYNEGVAAAKQIDDPEKRVRNLNHLLKTVAGETEWKNIVNAYDEGIATAEQIDNPEIKMYCLNSLLRTAAGKTEWKNIVDAYEEGIAAAKQIYTPMTRASTLDSLLGVVAGETEWKNIVEAYEEGIAAAQQIDHPDTRANTLNSLLSKGAGNVDWMKTEQLYRETIDIIEENRLVEREIEFRTSFAKCAIENESIDWDTVERIFDETVSTVSSSDCTNIPSTFIQVLNEISRLAVVQENDNTIEKAIGWCDSVEQKIEQTKSNKNDLDKIRKIRSEHFN